MILAILCFNLTSIEVVSIKNQAFNNLVSRIYSSTGLINLKARILKISSKSYGLMSSSLSKRLWINKTNSKDSKMRVNLKFQCALVQMMLLNTSKLNLNLKQKNYLLRTSLKLKRLSNWNNLIVNCSRLMMRLMSQVLCKISKAYFLQANSRILDHT